jgi:hypothetical protein
MDRRFAVVLALKEIKIKQEVLYEKVVDGGSGSGNGGGACFCGG